LKLLYFDTGMGAAGDMLTAALLELFPETQRKEILKEINSCGLPGVHSETSRVKRCGITGTLMQVKVDGQEEGEEEHHHHDHEETEHTPGHDHEGVEHHHHHHMHMDDIVRLVDGLNVPDDVKTDAKAVYERIARAEAAVHDTDVSEVHFHEVGMMDALTDVVSVSLMIRRLSPDKICAGTVTTGFGSVRCMHGILPVPAPATEKLLEGIPVQAGDIEGELCTPTGAALLGYFVDEFGPMPPMIIQKAGYGCGRKEFPKANCVRACFGEMIEEKRQDGQILCVNCNVDDMTPEDIAFATERIAEAGAVEVFTVPVGMKKSRPGTLIVAYCPPDKKDALLEAFFKYTSTIGVRTMPETGYRMKSEVREVRTGHGTVHVKKSSGFGAAKSKIDYNDAAKLAEKEHISLREARERLGL
jgi:uncharacterized protein (TIGR00299 family) protein